MADKLEDAFAQTAKLLFGKPLSPMKKYEGWIRQRVPGGKVVPSCFGKGNAYIPEYGFFSKVPHSRVASDEDAAIASGKRIAGVPEGISLAAIAKQLPEFAYFVPTYAEGTNINVQDTFSCWNCQNIKSAFDPWNSKNCAYIFSIMDSDSIFGVYRIIQSSFSIHIYNAYFVQRCFEMDGAKNCSDCYFCHNVESLTDCMFCFNVKSKRYAIGNVEVGKEKYLQIKQQLLEKIVPELENSGRLSFDIYDVLAKKKNG